MQEQTNINPYDMTIPLKDAHDAYKRNTVNVLLAEMRKIHLVLLSTNFTEEEKITLFSSILELGRTVEPDV